MFSLADLGNALSQDETKADKSFYAVVREVVTERQGDKNVVIGYNVSLGEDDDETVFCRKMAGAKKGDVVICTLLSNGSIVVTNRKDGDADLLEALDLSEEAERKAQSVVDRADAGEFDGTNGDDGLTPYIGDNGNWWIGDEDTGWSAEGDDGHSPYINSSTNTWYEWDADLGRYVDTGVVAQGRNGENGEDGMAIYCTCSTSASSASKDAYISSGSMPKNIPTGTTISVKFTNANTVASPKLDIYTSEGWTGYKNIRTNGVNYAYWQAGQEVMFTYDGTYWNVCSAPVYANTVTVGNPSGRNVYIDSDSVDIRNGSIVLATFESSVIRLGYNSSSSQITFCDDNGYVKYDTSPNWSSGTYTFQIGTDDYFELSSTNKFLMINDAYSSGVVCHQGNLRQISATANITLDASAYGRVTVSCPTKYGGYPLHTIGLLGFNINNASGSSGASHWTVYEAYCDSTGDAIIACRNRYSSKGTMTVRAYFLVVIGGPAG